jgi:hypothetical protein
MFRLRAPLLVAFGLVVACGGKVLVDESGSRDRGTTTGTATTGGTSGSYGIGGAYVAGFGTAGAYVAGAAGAYVAGAAGGYVGTGGFAGAGGGYTSCGPALCPPGTQCCNASCGICTPIGGGCPAIACGAGGSGIGGAGGTGGGGCGTPDSCLARIPGALSCKNEELCFCKSCMCEANVCESDAGCEQIWQCALKLNCHSGDCYAPDKCKSIIDSVGLLSMGMFVKLDACRSGSACAATCTPPVDAGVCLSPPPAAGGKCDASGPDDAGTDCAWSCVDLKMNTFVSKCSGSECSCLYNGSILCSCKGQFNRGSACGQCCPSSMGWFR